MLSRLVVLCAIINTYPGESLVSLFTAKHCRQCHNFQKTYNCIIQDNPKLEFNTTLINKETASYSKSMNITRIPVVVFDDGQKVIAVPKNYEQIRQKCKEISIQKNKKIHDDHLYSAKLCRDIYEDEFLHKSEKYIDNEETSVQCMFQVKDKTLFIVGRGSDEKNDWLHNIQFHMEKYPFKSNKKFHSGFLLQYMSIRDKFSGMLEHMIEKHDIKKVVLCGHSAASGLVTLAGFDLYKQLQNLETEVITFGSPRLSNRQFEKDFESNIKCTRYINDKDMITKLPFKILGYRHLGNPIWLRNNGKFIKKDPNSFQTFFMMLSGILIADIGVRDHFMEQYVKNMEEINNQ